MVHGVIPAVSSGELMEAMQALSELEDMRSLAKRASNRPLEFIQMMVSKDRWGVLPPLPPDMEEITEEVDPLMFDALSYLMASIIYVKRLEESGRARQLETAVIYTFDQKGEPPMPKLPMYYAGVLQECLRFNLGRQRKLPREMEAFEHPGIEHRIMDWISFIPPDFPFHQGSRPGQVTMLQGIQGSPWSSILIGDCIKMTYVALKIYTEKRIKGEGGSESQVMGVLQQAGIPIFVLSATTSLITSVVNGLMEGDPVLCMDETGEYELTGSGGILMEGLLF